MASLLFFGCVAYQQIELDHVSIVNKRLAVGDFIRIETLSDQEYTFVITKIDDKNIYGGEHVIAIADIKSVEKEKKTYDARPMIFILLFFLLSLYQDLGSGFF